MHTLTDPRAEASAQVRHIKDFGSPQRMRGTRETVLKPPEMQIELERERALEREKTRRDSPKTAQTSPKPPVSARISRPLRLVSGER